MQLLCVESDAVKAAAAEVAKAQSAVVNALFSGIEARLIARGDSIIETLGRDALILIREGALTWCINGQAQVMFEEGDIVGISPTLNLPGVELQSDFAVRLSVLSKAAIGAGALRREDVYQAYHRLQESHLILLSALFADLAQGESDFAPNIKVFEAGEVIIEEGSIGDEVYTLLEGHAEVISNGIRVGEVLADEVFGAIAVLTGTVRTASVRADKRSMVVVLKKEQFSSLVRRRPETVSKLITDMARTIVDLNRQVVGYKASKQ